MKFPDKFSVSHCGIQKPQCGIHISQCEIQIPHCETENIPKDFEEYAGAVEKYVGGKRSSLQSEVLAFLSEKHRKCVEKRKNVRRSSENSCIFACIE